MPYTPQRVRKIIETWQKRVELLTGGLPCAEEGKIQMGLNSGMLENHREEILVEMLDVANALPELTNNQYRCVMLRRLGYSSEEIAEELKWMWKSNVDRCLRTAFKKISKIIA